MTFEMEYLLDKAKTLAKQRNEHLASWHMLVVMSQCKGVAANILKDLDVYDKIIPKVEQLLDIKLSETI